jgi:hypothetical protein
MRGVLKPNGFNFFSVGNHDDKFCDKGQEIEKGIYDLNGFRIRFFTVNDIHSLTVSEGFEILQIKEEYEEPVTLYLVASKKH